jgi:hypothetical protein
MTMSAASQLAIRDEHHYLLTVREVRALAERCDTVEDAKSLADKATAAKVYAERAKLGGDMVNRAAAAKLWAERRAGELIGQTISHGGDRRSVSSSQAPNLKDLGVTGDQSSRWQGLAEIPAEDFEQAIEQVIRRRARPRPRGLSGSATPRRRERAPGRARATLRVREPR